MADHLKQRYYQTLCSAYKGLNYDDRGNGICIMCDGLIPCLCSENGFDRWFDSLTLTEIAVICAKMGVIAYQ